MNMKKTLTAIAAALTLTACVSETEHVNVPDGWEPSGDLLISEIAWELLTVEDQVTICKSFDRDPLALAEKFGNSDNTGVTTEQMLIFQQWACDNLRNEY